MDTVQWASVERAQARQPRTAFSSLIPSPYLTGAPKRASHALLSPPSSLIPTLTGAPKRASHALLSLPSSLIPTLQARPSAPATHCFLFPHPFSLPYRCAQAHQPRTAFSSLLPNPYLTSAPKRASHALSSLPSSLISEKTFSNLHHIVIHSHHPFDTHPADDIRLFFGV